ncbi:DHA2 family efflux MFS transporter permease subunit [Sphingomonas prati]|uniref:EmrB/QacA subfamily drug resistance transporter n=1 Tax=Sphingomonas prati TaxID=1843237 RepID=A0A7W9BPE8_9SPHN|nr:DHA2 family efflux MFS transporter permease subunit [Sphingomonas prati]MBB5727731.1 EmrB/QacA subfamily drug resistance transporter [Sphingomonas prati]
MRLRRRGLASINAEVRDGILPAADSVALVPLEQASGAGSVRNYRVVALIIACALFMEQMDATVLATALPTMARDFGVLATAMSGALTSYLLALAIFIPASGWLADRFGSRTMFRLAILLFMGGSLLCGQATSLPFMMGARFLQGLGGAMMIPIGRLVLLRSVNKEDMVSAMSWLIMPALIGPILGPPVGGFIVTYLDWRWIFWLNLPIGTLGVVLVTKYIGDYRAERRSPFDGVGFVLSGVSLGCLLFGFEMASRSGEAATGVGLAAVGLVAGWFYIRHAARVPNPIMDLSLMRIASFRLSVIAGSLTRITQGAQPFLLPLMLQLGFGMTAAASGTITVAGAMGSLAMKGLAPRVLRRFGFRRALVTNGLVASAGYAVCGLFRPDWPVAAIFATLLACGFFMSFQFTAYNTIAYDEIPKERMSSATSFYATFQQLMLSLGICTGAAALHGGMLVSGASVPSLGDFTAAFLVVTAISASATIFNLRFAKDAGAELSGHRG